MYVYDHPHPAVTADVAVFALRDGALQVLLIQRAGEPHKGSWALPGGFVEIDEDIEHAARRELREETHLDEIWLEQLHAFGRPDRDPRERVITVAYYAVVAHAETMLRAASDAADARWFSLADLPPLAFDHDEVLAMARERLMMGLDCSTTAFRFLPEEFSLTELQEVYEAILGKAVDGDVFRERLLSFGVLEETGRVTSADAHRARALYRLSANAAQIMKTYRQAAWGTSPSRTG